MTQPKLLELTPDRLQPNPWNTNIVDPINETKLDESVRRNGLFKPVIVREIAGGVYEIIGGEHRWEAAKRVGLQTVPVVNLGTISDEKAKEISIIDNARYGADDVVALSELLKELGSMDDLQIYLPYGDEDLTSIFSSSDIALDELGVDENFEKTEEDDPEPPAAKAPKTHTVMRFKVSLNDAEKITALIAKTQRAQGLNTADDLTNAGDALVHLLVDQFDTKPAAASFELDDIDDLIEKAAAE